MVIMRALRLEADRGGRGGECGGRAAFLAPAPNSSSSSSSSSSATPAVNKSLAM